MLQQHLQPGSNTERKFTGGKAAMEGQWRKVDAAANAAISAAAANNAAAATAITVANNATAAANATITVTNAANVVAAVRAADLSIKTGLELPFRPPAGNPQSGLLATLSVLQDERLKFKKKKTTQKTWCLEKCVCV